MITKKAGTVLINKKKKQVALVYRKRKGDLSFPKGHLEDGETLEECAIRETVEETGRDCHLILKKPIGIMSYTTPNGEECETYVYLAYDDGKHVGDSVDPEVCVWLDIDDVENALSYDNLIKFWKAVYAKVKKKI